jgi:ubiquinone/menaquinone biosynthesis C-methylase UbiE
MFSKSAKYYDSIYLETGKDYAGEAEKVHGLIHMLKKTSGNSLLDVACGTGQHIVTLRKHYQVEGLDLDEKMLAIARAKFPDIPFHHASMLDFDLGREFDAVTCLFSSIGYVKTTPNLNRAIGNMARHLKPGGVLVVEPWISPEDWKSGKVHALFVDNTDFKLARMNISERKGNLAFFNFHYLVATDTGVEHFTELHELGLFTQEEYMAAFRSAGLSTMHDGEGLIGRGLYIGFKEVD